MSEDQAPKLRENDHLVEPIYSALGTEAESASFGKRRALPRLLGLAFGLALLATLLWALFV